MHQQRYLVLKANVEGVVARHEGAPSGGAHRLYVGLVEDHTV